jgi:hypothetical protein
MLFLSCSGNTITCCVNSYHQIHRDSRIQLFGRGAQLGGDVALDSHDGLESPEDGAGSSSDDEQGGSEAEDDSDSGGNHPFPKNAHSSMPV